jgi:Ca2+-binding RTX toxin-like protein
MTGTDGADVLSGTSSSDTISSGLGDDVIYGNSGNDVINADVSIIPALAQANSDTVLGGRGNDVIRVGSGRDIVDGGPGNDDIELAVGGMLVPFIPDDGSDTVIFQYSSRSGFGHDTVRVVQADDVFVFLDRSGQTNSLADLAAQTQLLHVGDNTYEMDWLIGDQAVTLHLDNNYLKYTGPPGDTVDWDNFTTLDQLATVVTFQFQYPFV